ncbi:YheC/YheD family protein [Salipaludibacillus aurantiacus]|uniref:YheC/D like ATP-grasp n=1 Tax=Salipaludibacillus aurantiacus TaxID=1601833 RepID=A0A1H9UMV9_9BACI|nr:YheC/YheD family protein [Salipaludibacillus aurantiacus]SES10786.1 YheC/D like ATP-grasp [Salipaludibacillus aurantiacus]
MLKVKWIPRQGDTDIYLPKSMKSKDKLTSNKIYFRFGSWKRKLAVKFLEELPKDVIKLASDLKEDLFIPEDLTFNFKITNNTLQLGPVILWIASNTGGRLARRLPHLQTRIEQFVPEKGMICLCAEDGIDPEKKEIKGYYYCPQAETGELKWKEANFFSPGAVFKRVRLSEDINNHLIKLTNGKMFNSYFFNKWEMWQWLSPDSILRKYLPYTKKADEIKHIKEMLSNYPCVYVKPARGSEGRSIIKMERDKNGFLITDDKQQKTFTQHLETHPLIEKRLNSSKEYLVQQGLPVNYDSSHVDFRIYMQKGASKRWRSSGITARISQKGSIITNVRCMDYWLPGHEAFRQIYNLDKKKAALLERKIVKICSRACRRAGRKGTYGDIAIDFVVDEDLHFWILEMNMRNVYPVEDPALEAAVKGTPFLYAMSLDGFPVKRKKVKKN